MKINYLNNNYSIDQFISLPSKDQWILDIQYFLKQWHDRSEYIAVNTSGSTGKPKIIQLKKTGMRTSAAITNNYFNLNKYKNALLCLPAKFIAGKMMVVRAIEADMNLIIKKPTSFPLIKLDQKIDFIAMTPMQIEASLDYDIKLFNLINTAIIGGGAVSEALMDRLQNINSDCYQTYGMTETITHIALQRINSQYKTDYFKVLDGFEIGQDDRDCLTITADHIYNKSVITNDIVEILSPNTFKWIGRYDNVINTGGVKVFPETIESKLQSLIEVPFFISGTVDDTLGQMVTLCIESKKWDNAVQSELLKKINSRLSKFEMPRSILFFDCFKYTDTGKIRRKATLDDQ